MDPQKFDRLARVLASSRPTRRAALGLLGAGLVSLLPSVGIGDSEARKRCARGKKRCGRHCIPKDDCCKDTDCGTGECCTGGVCAVRKAQGEDCTEDAQCCTGICDTYSNKCQQVRVSCTSDDQCPGGRCCENTFGGQCIYETATQGPCEPEVSCGFVLCGDRCSDITDGTYQFCGFDGSAACRKGRCCCPKGIPRSDCPNIQKGSGFLRRCD